MGHAVEIAAFLGGTRELHRKIENDFDLISLSQRGLPVKTFRLAVKHSGFSQEEVISSLGLSRTTMLRRLKTNRLGKDESEKTLRFARVFTDVLDVFDGDASKAREWLRRPNRGLGGERPLDLLRTELGARQVEITIGRLREGVFG